MSHWTPLFAEVAVAVPVDRLFTYRVPEALRAEAIPGRRVRVPFGPRSAAGYLVATGEVPPPGVAPAKVKEVQAFLDEGPLLDHPLLELARFVSRWYGGSLGEALDAAIPSAAARVASGAFARRATGIRRRRPPDLTAVGRAASRASPREPPYQRETNRASSSRG